MRRRWSARVLLGTAIVLAVGASGTALAMAAQPADPTGPGAEGDAPALPPDDAFTRCLVANGAQVDTETSADGRRSVRVTIDPAHQSPALDACQRYVPAPGTVGGPAPIQPLTTEQNAAVTKCLLAAGVTVPAPGTTQVLGLPPADEPLSVGPAPDAGDGSGTGSGSAPAPGAGDGPILMPGPGVGGGLVISGAPGARGGLVISGESGAGGEAAPGGPDLPGDAPDLPDAKVLGALGQCAQAAGLPGLALETHSGDRTTTVVAMAMAEAPRS
ncbi:hypothetical protein [Parafrankia discariae]|uniref:hypothetical protein n=1 Tax=Parafrankia discariae TaxID=365528 RepID=UPI00039EE488|nr:hypothetical protein [Parafrankia discariae]